MWEKFKVWFVDMTNAAFDYIFSSDEGQIRMLCLYVVMFLACLVGMVYTAYRAVSCFLGATFWTDAVLTVWFGILAVVTYVLLLALSECFTSYK